MALNPSQYKQALLKALGGASATLTTTAVDQAWERYSAFSNLEVRYQKALIALIDLLLGGSWKNFELRTTAGEVLHGEQPFEHLLELARRAEAALEVLLPSQGALASASDGAAPSMSEMEADAPLQTPYGLYPDPNSTAYYGDRYARYRG